MSQMPVNDPKTLTISQQMAALRKEIEDMRRQMIEEGYRKPEEDRAIFSHPGAPVAATPSPAWTYQRPRGYLTRVMVTARQSGTSDTTVIVKKRSGGSNIVLATVVLSANDEYTVDDDLMTEVEDLDRIIVEVSALGAGLLDLTVTASFVESVG